MDRSSDSGPCFHGEMSFIEKAKCAAREEVEQNWSILLQGVNFIWDGGRRSCSSNRQLLEAKSPKFKQLFEAQGTTVDMSGYNFEAFKEMLAFLHRGQLPNWAENGEYLLEYAAEFQLETLKGLVEKYQIAPKLTTETARKYYVHAKKCGAIWLMEQAKELIILEVKSRFDKALEKYFENLSEETIDSEFTF